QLQLFRPPLQLPNLSVELIGSYLGFFGFVTVLKGSPDELPLPLGELIGMGFKTLGELRKRLAFFPGFNGHPGLEFGSEYSSALLHNFIGCDATIST
ncbi:MAG: hypothetical protein AAGN35_24010, partial [Bacteroidota bacterium]